MTQKQHSSARTGTNFSFTVLPHEWMFGGFLALMTARLAAGVGMTQITTLAFLAYAVICIAVVYWSGPRPSPTRWRIRLLWYPCAMGLSFYTLATAVHQLGVPSADARLATWDHALLGMEPAQVLASLHLPWFTDLMVVAYLFFFYYLIFGPAYYCIHHLARFRACFVGLFTTYALGFYGYTVLPAGGPHLAMTGLPPLPGGLLTHWMLPLVNHGSNGVDVFPSLHAGASLFLLGFDFRHYRRRFWTLLLPCLALLVSTIYLRYHYVVDLLGGLCIALAGLGMVAWYERSALARAVDAG